jgi:hypothetical protein
LLIDDLLPDFQFSERHEIAVAAPAERVYGELLNIDLSASLLIKSLLWLRTLPSRVRGAPRRPAGRLTMEGVLGDGFVILDQDPPNEIVLGTIGRFWRPRGDLQRFSSGEFATFRSPGYARVAWNFTTAEESGMTRLATETRVHCTDTSAEESFRRYWLLVRPFSGLIRREMLKAVKRQAEAAAG